MKLFIETFNGKAINHPILEDNLLTVYEIDDVSKIPVRFEKFIRKEQPTVKWYQRLIVNYIKDENGDWIDSFEILELNKEQRLEELNMFKSPYDSWVINDDVTEWVAPKAIPNDGKTYKWNENIKDWEKININSET